eukprot:1037504_1
MALSVFLIVFVVSVQSSWESVWGDDGWEEVLIPSQVHRALTSCLGNLTELMFENNRLNTRIQYLEAQIARTTSLAAHTTATSDTLHPTRNPTMVPTKEEQTLHPTLQPTKQP